MTITVTTVTTVTTATTVTTVVANMIIMMRTRTCAIITEKLCQKSFVFFVINIVESYRGLVLY